MYLPFKPKRRTKATIAKEKGLEPLAEFIMDNEVEGTVEELAERFIVEHNNIKSIDGAIEGAGYIIAEWFSENATARKVIREELIDKGILEVSVTKEWEEKRSKFELYYNYKEPVKSIPSHRFLAIRRGESEKVLSVKINIDKELILSKIELLLFSRKHKRREYLSTVLEDAYHRLIFPSVESDILSELKDRSDEEAIEVFAANLRKLLMTPAAGSIRVMGADPGFRTGCKVVSIDETGKVLDVSTIFPIMSAEKTEEAKDIVLELIKKDKIKAVAIGNGTASRETYAFFKAIVPNEVTVSIISEAGASVYSASDVARKEFPDYDVSVRGAISIARRFQDPLAELVKIDPKSIGVGQYQHDVNQSLLKKKLDNVVVMVVNQVGVDLNTASYHLLRYVSGIGDVLAKNIVGYRDEHGLFKNRRDLLNVPKFGEKAFQQSAGFLRIQNGDNLLDSTGIHPEAYHIVERIMADLNATCDKLIRNKELISSIDPADYVTEEFGLPTIQDILNELLYPGKDPRKDFEIFEFSDEVKEFEDVKENMILKGVVTNVTKFGAFVDIGIHQDALIHISEISNKFVKNPEEAISVGDKVRVKVIKVDPELRRVYLSLKQAK